MPAGNLTVVDNVTGVVVATGCRTVKQAELEIFNHMREIAAETEDENIARSYSLMSPYKKFGDSGVKGFEIPRADLMEEQTEDVEDVDTEDEADEAEELEDLDIV